MLKALGEQLKLLSADPQNHYTSAIRQLTGPREAVRYGQPLRQMILALPKMIAQLRHWSNESGLPIRVRRIHVFALDYLYNPTDFLPANDSGFFRYLDDAYLIARIYLQTLQEKDSSGFKNQCDDPDIEKQAPKWIDLARRLLPRETLKIDKLVDNVAQNK
ncbi:hypothetical protein BVX98_05330 [bacterium F11]|nr:hypothetical protein BVX98_05330 [bacterium F11]